jgi:hypothetical protein
VGAAVNYRDLARDLEGGTMTGVSGRYEKRGSLQGSATSGYRLYGDGPHRIEVHARGFRSWRSPVIVLVAGETRRLDVVLQPESVAAAPVSAETIRTLAGPAALEGLRLARKDTSDLRVELLGDPILLPDHRAFHRDHTRTAGRTPPDAIAAAAIRARDVFRESVLIVFRGEQGQAEFSYNGSPGFLPLEEREWREVSAALERFYASAVDVARGPERFHPYLPEDMREALGSPAPKRRLLLPLEAVERELSNDELRQYAGLMLDMAALNQWMEFEGLDRFADLPRQLSPNKDSRAFIRGLASVLAERRRTLKNLGAFEPRHIDACVPFVRRLLGEGLVAREDPARDRITHLPEGSRMYAAPLGGFTAALFPHFVLVNGQIRIVAFDMP